MRIKTFEKLNLKKFLILSIPPTTLCLLFSKWPMEWVAVLVIYAATIIYMTMFAEAIYEMTAPYQNTDYKVNKRKLSILFIGKLVILISALLFGVHIMGTKIIIPLLNYFIHIIVFGVSLDKTNK